MTIYRHVQGCTCRLGAAALCLVLSGCAVFPRAQVTGHPTVIPASTATPRPIPPTATFEPTPTYALVPTDVPATATPAPSGYVGKAPLIAYQSYVSMIIGLSDAMPSMPSGSDILLRRGGGAITRLTSDGHNYRPQWSPDGQYLMYLHIPDDHSGQVMIVARNGQHPQSVLALSRATAGINWASSGHALIYGTITYPQGMTQSYGMQPFTATVTLHALQVAGGPAPPVRGTIPFCNPTTAGDVSPYTPFIVGVTQRFAGVTPELQWSPATNTAVVATRCNGWATSTVVRTDTGKVVQLSTRPSLNAQEMQLSPDGRRILYLDSQQSQPLAQLYAGGSNGQNMRIVPFTAFQTAAFGLQEMHVQWSPDGRWMYIFGLAAADPTSDAKTGYVARLHPDGSGLEFLVNRGVLDGRQDTNFTSDVAHVTISPDGRYLGIETGHDTDNEGGVTTTSSVYVMDLNAGSPPAYLATNIAAMSMTGL